MKSDASEKSAAATPDEVKNSKKKGRSPAYPGIDLERAIELARKLYKEEKQHPAAPETVTVHWGFKPNSSQFFTAASALKKFGLLDALPQRGPHSGHIKVSDLARDIIVDEREDSSDRASLIRRAALLPPIHGDIWRKYGGELPSDSSLRYYLIRDLKFTDVGANEFIGQLRRTIAFAEVTPSDSPYVAGTDAGSEGEQSLPRAPGPTGFISSGPQPAQQYTPPPGPGQMREVPIPIQGSAWPLLRATFPLSEEAWTQMIAVLQAMKPGLVESKKE